MCSSLSKVTLFGLILALAMANPIRRQDICLNFPVNGVGVFQNQKVFTFESGVLPEGLYASDNEFIEDTAQNGGDVNIPHNHVFLAGNVVVRDGFLQLIVPGGQDASQDSRNAVHAAQVFTGDRLLHASVRTHAILSSVPGTIQSPFFYASDQQEIDIELVSDPTSQSAINNAPTIYYTNQRATADSPATATADTAPANFDTEVHEYRIDWTEDYTAFFIDGVEKQRFTENVPTIEGPWVWNNWANGDLGFSVGPPAVDSIMKIQRIEMFFNTTADAQGC